jgi:hypothetical protein
MSRFVILRTREAGIHCGTLVEEDLGQQWVKLTNARRVWRWRGANTLHEMSKDGLAKEYTKISEPIDSITVLGVKEILDCTDKAKEDLTTSRWDD